MASAYRSSRDSGAPEGHGTMQAWYKDEKIAESNRTVLLEGNHCNVIVVRWQVREGLLTSHCRVNHTPDFPPESVDKAFLSLSNHTSVCGWKGTAYCKLGSVLTCCVCLCVLQSRGGLTIHVLWLLCWRRLFVTAQHQTTTWRLAATSSPMQPGTTLTQRRQLTASRGA